MFHGIYVPVVTPFHSDGSLDLASLTKLCERLVADGIAGLLPLGTTGEASALDASERALVIETCAKAIAGTDVELVIGVGTNATAGTLSRVAEVEQYSPDALLVVTPYYVRPNEEGILAHFLSVADAADAIDTDVMLYNIPARTGRYVSTQGLLSVATHKRINGVKQAVGGIDEETAHLLAQAPDSFSVLAGDDAFIAPMCFLGAQGGVSASAHLATTLWVEMVDAATAGEVSLAREIHEKLLRIVSAGFAEPNPTVFKGVLAATGEIETDFVRLPLIPASSGVTQKCVDALKQI